MPHAFGFMFESGAGLTPAAALLAVTALVALIRRPALSRRAMGLFFAGAVALALAAGGLTWNRPRVGRVAVIIDLSPSTRTARYHDREQLARRLSQLLGRMPYTLYRMAETTSPAKTNELSIDNSARHTTYDPPAGADVVLLFSDGQFPPLPPPASGPVRPPTYIAIDPELDDPKDTAIERLEVRGDGGDGSDHVVAVTVDDRRGDRQIVLTNTDPAASQPAALPSGRNVITARVRADASEVSASLRGPRDRWPENDSLLLRLAPPLKLQRWLVAARDAGSESIGSGGWRRLSPAQLSSDPAEYLNAAAIVLDNLSVDDLSPRQLECIEQYVRDLGGGVVIVGGDHAFAAGHYTGSALERISPLASTPPTPAQHWILLADNSGSMAAALGDNTRWAFALSAITRLIPLLPPDDTISIGSFADSLRWWQSGRAVRELQQRFDPPRDFYPNGPTNLGPALQQLAEGNDPALPSQLILLTDAQAKIDRPDELAARLRRANVRVHLMATETALAADNPVRRIVEQTGGTIVTEADPRLWVRGLRILLRAIAPGYLEARSPLRVTFTEAGPALAEVTASPWNGTWLKRSATELASGRASVSDDSSVAGDDLVPAVPAAAAWFSGNGAVIALAFHADGKIVSVLAERVALPPRDPRFVVSWDPGRRLTVTIDAAEGDRPLNRLSPQLELLPGEPALAAIAAAAATTSPGRTPTPIPQIAPGRYRLEVAAPLRPMHAAVRLDGHAIDPIAVAARYPPEFDAIGNDRSAMRELARATGGEVIEPAQITPIDFRWPVRRVNLSSCLAACGTILIGAGAVAWKRGH